ncbi:MAG TPA: DedA family protein [Candidatus Dormibacteraeota bacterium]|nr:DedA family protein [Candidatus Dormibacteraeota bacterium]
MGEAIQHAMAAHAWEALVIVFLLAWLEYVFPPVPGDSTMLFGFFLAGSGALSFPAVFLAALSGSVLGALTAYRLGTRLGRTYFFLKSAWAREELDKVERWFGRFGPRLLAVNRFIPGVRGFFLYAAGIGRMEARGVVIYSSLSNVLWVAVLAWGGTGLGSTWEEVRVVFRRYVWGIAVFLAVYLGLSIARSRRRRRVGLRSSS